MISISTKMGKEKNLNIPITPGGAIRGILSSTSQNFYNKDVLF